MQLVVPANTPSLPVTIVALQVGGIAAVKEQTNPANPASSADPAYQGFLFGWTVLVSVSPAGDITCISAPIKLGLTGSTTFAGNLSLPCSLCAQRVLCCSLAHGHAQI